MSTKTTVGLTAWLALLVIGAVVPLLVLSGLTLFEISKNSRALIDQEQAETARALALAVDGEVRAWRSALEALAASKSLQPGRMAEFYEEARHVAAQYEGWIVLNDALGQQRLNTLLPWGAPLPRTGARDMVDAVFREGKPLTDMVFGAAAQRYIISNSIPVLRDGRVVFCFSLNFGPERLTRLLQRQQLPPTWVAAISDSQRRVVARSRDAEARVGTPEVEWFAAATRAADHGLLTGPITDGRTAQVAFHRLQDVPWIVALAVPASELQSAASIWGFILVGVVLGLAAVGVAAFTGRRVTMPVARMAAAGGPLVRGEGVDVGPASGIQQVRELQQAVVEASESIQARYRERDRAEETLRRANEALELRVQERTAALAKVNEALEAACAVLQEDVQRRERAEDQLAQQANKLQEQARILDLAHVLIQDTDNRIVLWNTGAEQLYGWTAAEAVGRVSYQLLQTVFPASLEDVQAALSAAGHWEGELVHTAKDGRCIVVASHWVLHRDAWGTPRVILEVNNDITDRKRAEEQLRLLSQALESAANGVAITDRQGQILWVNPAFTKLTGYSREEAVGQNPRVLRSGQHPPEFYRELWRTVLCGEPWHGQLINRRKDGTLYTEEMTITPVRAGGGDITHFIAIKENITDRKRAEEENRWLAKFPEENPHPVLRIGCDGRILYANRASAPLLHLWERQVGQDLPEAWRARAAEVYGEGRPHELEVECAERTYSCTLTPVVGAAYVNIYGRDITNRKHAEEEIRRLNAELEQRLVDLREANAELESFSYSVSHDLRAPLRAMNGFSRILVEEHGLQLSPEAQRYLRLVRENTQQMGRLVDDLLAFSRLSRVTLQRQPVDLATLAHQVFESLQAERAGREVELVVGSLPLCEGDPALLKQVVANLLDNALKFTRGRAPARIEMGCQMQSGVPVYFVRDNGVGFDMRYSDKLFGVFQRLHRAEEYEGTGVGLAIVQRIIQRHGGRVCAEGEVGQGAAFYFTVAGWPPIFHWRQENQGRAVP